jgi:hypothetical protein
MEPAMRAILAASTAQHFVESILADGLWHTTSRERYASILAEHRIRVEPNVSDKDRHKTGNGPANYPYVRTLGGVSLFDFSGFDPNIYGQQYSASSWAFFVPVRSGWSESIWIEIDRLAIAPQFIDGQTLLDRWRSEEAWGHTIMPKIETAHIEDIIESKFRRALLVHRLPHSFSIEPLAIYPTDTLKASRSAPAPR